MAFGIEALVQASDNSTVVHRQADTQEQISETTNSLFTWVDLKNLFQTDANHAGHWQFYRDGHQIDAALMGLLDKEGRLCAGQLDQLLDQGMSVMVNRLELKLPRLANLAKWFEELTGAYVRVVAIGSPGRAPGMPLHYDHVDVIALQTAGAKTWLLFGPPVAGCGVRSERDHKPSEITDQAQLGVGDLLFVPAGIHHRCLPSERSLHLAFNLKWPTFLDIDPGLTDQAELDQHLLDPVRTFGQPVRIDAIANTLSELASSAMTRYELGRFFENWPSRCAQRWQVSDLRGYF